MNFDMQQEVWRRVQASDTPVTPQRAVLPEKLPEMIGDEKQDSETYRRLSYRVQGADREALRRISAEEANHARELNTLYYLLTDRRTEPQPRVPELPTQLRTALRERCLAEAEGSRAYRRAAEDFPEQRELFLRLAEDEHRHHQTLMRMLGRYMKD
ncbi:MAG: ferritin family protein [Firmicutes bacterium]|nr:ferritin family protein [Bacillota bacterium]